MTVATLIRCHPGTFNLLAVDSLAMNENGEVFVDEKLRCLWGDTFVTAVGDAMLLTALEAFVAWHGAIRPDLRSPAVISELLAGLEVVRRSRRDSGLPVHPNPGAANLIVCSRTDAFVWMSGFDLATNTFARPTSAIELESGDGLTIWGQRTEVPMKGHFVAPPAYPLDLVVEALERCHAAVEAGGSALPYKLRPPYSRVLLPHDPGAPIQRERR